MDRVDALMKQAVSNSVFSGGVLLVHKDASLVFHGAYGYSDIFSSNKISLATIFDLASLTKPLATTLAVMRLVELGRLDINRNIGSIIHYFKNTDKAGVTILNLLLHNSGLCDYRPYYKELFMLPPKKRKDRLRILLTKESLINSIGKRVLYSDLGFMILAWVVEEITKTRLDNFLYNEVYSPVGIDPDSLFYIDPSAPPSEKCFAATEFCRWRNTISNGVVHDENAYAAGGIGGHSGLFGSAIAIKILLLFLLRKYHGCQDTGPFNEDLVKSFFLRDSGTGRALGFDTPSPRGSAGGRLFSEKTVGHLGFTGTSFWMDLKRSIIVILLTNRVHPSRNNNKIKLFRPQLHDAVMADLV